MTHRNPVRACSRVALAATIFLLLPLAALAAPFAAMVMDARTGKVLYSTNAETRLHPASLTKMMTLYIVFDAVRRGEISLDDVTTISRNAASEPPSKLGMRVGQKIKLRYLVRAAAIKSANDAATALGEAVAGSEQAFAQRMNEMAKVLGMTHTTFKNANGLTREGHLSTAHDMTIMGRHLLYDFPEYYNLFSRQSANAGGKTVRNTNHRFLRGYRGADGIKTGYTAASGYNLVASAERGQERIIVTVFGSRSVATRTAKVEKLLDIGFRKAPSRAAFIAPTRLALGGDTLAAHTRSASGLVTASLRPEPRPGTRADPAALVAMKDEIADTIAKVAGEAEAQAAADEATAPAVPVLSASLAGAMIRPAPRPVVAEGSSQDDGTDKAVAAVRPVVVTRMSTSGGQQWGINVGRYTTQFEAEKMLLQTALVETTTLDQALRKVVRSPRGWEANFVGLTQERAQLACRRLVAQNMTCTPVGPG